MPKVLPNGYAAQLQWFATRLPKWLSDPAAIGLSPSQVAGLAALLDEAQDHQRQARALRIAAKSATARANTSASTVRERGGVLIKTIKAFAESTQDPEVWARAQIPPPLPRSTSPAPDMPSHVSLQLQTAGAVQVRWKARRAAPHTGVSFVVYRRLDTESSYSLCGISGVREFIDDSIPPGTVCATYMVQAVRSNLKSPLSEPTGINFAGMQFSGSQMGAAA